MAQLTISSYEEFEKYLGQELGVSEYIRITQDQINLFADATHDHQWIHLDEERAKKETPFKSTIAHGFLTLSVLPYLWEQIVEFKNVKMLVNYGIESLKFNQAVLVNNKVRARVGLHTLKNLRGVTKAQLKVRLEIEGNEKPAYDVIMTFLYHFN